MKVAKELLPFGFFVVACLIFVAGFHIIISYNKNNTTIALISLGVAIFLGLAIGESIKKLGVEKYKEKKE